MAQMPERVCASLKLRAWLERLDEHRLRDELRQRERWGDGAADGHKVAEEAPEVGGLDAQVRLRGHRAGELGQALLQAQPLQGLELQHTSRVSGHLCLMNSEGDDDDISSCMRLEQSVRPRYQTNRGPQA